MPYPPPRPPTNGMGVAGFVLGLLSVLLSFSPLGLLLGIVGIVLSALGRVQRGMVATGLATAGLVLSIVGTSLSVIVIILLSAIP